MTSTTAELVIVEYQDIVVNASSCSDSFQEKIKHAFGPDGIGIIAIRNVPNFVELKQQVLEMAHPLAHLSETELKELEDPESLYNAGWSHGKEMLKGGKPDVAKGSFYFNPLIDVPSEADRKAYPVSYPINKWPTNPSLLPMEKAAKALGSLMKDVAVHVSQHVDSLAHKTNPAYPNFTLFHHLKDSEKVKGRLLYYFPLSQERESKNEQDSWIGWHNDSGFLTALAGDLYLDEQGIQKETSPPDAGLYVVTRQDQVKKITIPKDCMAIQIGECTQILTGGAVKATPHCVKGGGRGVARASMACFIDVPPTIPLSLPPNATPKDILAMESNKVPTMATRWENHMTFGNFLQKTFAAYYNS